MEEESTQTAEAAEEEARAIAEGEEAAAKEAGAKRDSRLFKQIRIEARVPLSEEELADCAVQMSAASFTIQRVQDQKKEADKKFKARIDEQLEELKELSEKVRDGQLKEVDAVEIYDFEKGKVRTVRAGTDRVISERDMTERDRQMRLDDATPEGEATAPTPAAETEEEESAEVPEDETASSQSVEEETTAETREEASSEASQDEEASPPSSEEGGKEKGKDGRSFFSRFIG